MKKALDNFFNFSRQDKAWHFKACTFIGAYVIITGAGG